MLEIAQNFEQVAAEFRPVVLIGPGLAAVWVGLFVWLGGLGVRRVLLAVVGAITAFGTTEQLLPCQHAKEKLKRKKEG